MAGTIRVLDEAVINRIAAGEVVERPASVVKELVENSLDAQATSILVDIENGGRKLIRIRDNGTGMGRDDAFLALERHATSKLETEKDLVGVETLGFRGEALASIASVSRLRLITFDGQDPAGTELVMEGGVFRKSERIGVDRGTVVEVHNLFFNVPVRRRFLKGPGVEAALVGELVTKFALAHPEVAFTYREEGKVKIDTPAVKSTLERIHTLYSRDVRENLMEVEHSVDRVRLHGFVGRPPYARSNMRSVLTFVNRRAVRDRLINNAVSRAFANLMERGRYPLAILFLELPSDQVDVNVHPQKAEVRFVKPQEVFNVIVDGVHQAVMGAPFNVPRYQRESIFPRPPTTPVHRHLREERESPADSGAEVPWMPAPAPQAAAAPLAAPDERVGRFSTLGVLGTLPGSFIVLYDDEGLLVLDHHAAHERVLFEELLHSEEKGSRFDSQDLLIPTVLEFSAVEARALGLHLALLRRKGFHLEEFGENDFVVKSVPSWVGNVDMAEFFDGIVQVALDTGFRGHPEQLEEELLKSMACKAAVKETTSLHPEEVRALLKDLDRLGSIDVCPHGRPFLVRFPFSEIRRKMGRK